MQKAGSYRSLLAQKDFLAFLFSQFTTAFNDNAFKLVVMLLALQTNESGYIDFYYIAAQFFFVLPFLLFSGYSGYFSDKYAKNSVIIYTKGLEVIIMVLAVYFLWHVNKSMLVLVLFILSTQSVFLSPSKYGILPEIFPEEDISRANGILELLTFVAIIFGQVIAGALMQFYENNTVVIGLFLFVLAISSFITSFYVRKVPVSGSVRKWSFNPWAEINGGIKEILDNKLILTVIGGISFFFAIGLAVTTNILVFGREIFALTPLQLSMMNASMGLGIGLGSIAAGSWSGDKIELGLIPLGAIGLTICLFGVSYTTVSVLNLFIELVLLGFFAGLFIVPLNALLQELPEKQEKGRLIATNNFFNSVAMLLTVLLLGFLQGVVRLSPDNIMFVLAFITLIFSIITLSFNPRFFIRFIIIILTSIFYRINVVGRPNIPKHGPALIVSNHVSYIDGLIISSVLPRFIRYIAHKTYYDHPILNPLMRFAYAIPIESGSEEKISKSIARARQALQEGHVVCVFAEGRLTRTGNLLQFKSGFERIMEGLDNIPIIPVYLDQLWESVFAPSHKTGFFRVPQQFPVRITVTLGDPMLSNSKAWQVRQAVQELAVEARSSGNQKESFLSVEFLKNATSLPHRYCIYNQQKNQSESFSRFSSKVLFVAHKLKKLHENEKRIAVLLASNYDAVLLNIAIVMAGKSVVNIPEYYNYEDIIALKKDLNITSIYTYINLNNSHNNHISNKLINEHNARDANKFLEKVDSKLNSFKWHLIGVLKYILPVKLVVKSIGHLPDNTESEIAVLLPGEFNSKSNIKSNNKYIIISHESVYNNISGLKQILDSNSSDRYASMLNFNNPYAFTANLWLPLIIGNGSVPVDYNLDIKENLVIMHNQRITTLLCRYEDLVYIYNNISINLLGYIKNIICIDSLNKMTEDFISNFNDKFSIQILTCYGVPELGPFITLSTTNIKIKGMLQRGSKRNSVGHPLPNVATRVLDIITKKPVAPGEQGILEIKTPSYMMGYAHKLDNKNVEFHLNEWFNTGLTATIDEDGFVFIKD